MKLQSCTRTVSRSRLSGEHKKLRRTMMLTKKSPHQSSYKGEPFRLRFYHFSHIRTSSIDLLANTVTLQSIQWCKKTGWVMFTVAGGPSPRGGGAIEVMRYDFCFFV